MRRVILAGLFALPAALLLSTSAPAASPPGYSSATGTAVTNPFLSCKHLGCGGFCFRLFPGLHQDGPLFNYGPYYGYYPFEPYGPWTADLQYNGPTGDCGGNCGQCGGCRARLWHRGDSRGSGCGGWGSYALSTFHNVGHRVRPFAHKCMTCGGSGAATEAAPSADCPNRASAQAAPAEAGTPSAHVPGEPTVLQTGYPRRER